MMKWKILLRCFPQWLNTCKWVFMPYYYLFLSTFHTMQLSIIKHDACVLCIYPASLWFSHSHTHSKLFIVVSLKKYNVSMLRDILKKEKQETKSKKRKESWTICQDHCGVGNINRYMSLHFEALQGFELISFSPFHSLTRRKYFFLLLNEKKKLKLLHFCLRETSC